MPHFKAFGMVNLQYEISPILLPIFFRVKKINVFHRIIKKINTKISFKKE
jgi:hypothetical protein